VYEFIEVGNIPVQEENTIYSLSNSNVIVTLVQIHNGIRSKYNLQI